MSISLISLPFPARSLTPRTLVNSVGVLALTAALAACGGSSDAPPPAVAAVAPPAPVKVVAQTPPKPAEMDRLATTYVVKEGQDLMDTARQFDLGGLEIKIANPGVDEWIPKAGKPVVIPNVHLVPGHLEDGILVNLAQLRLYRFEKGVMVETHPLGIGREGLNTPLGSTTIISKRKNPTWTPTARMRKENPDLPAVVGPGPDNPLGDRALYLGWDLYRIHGTNIPWGVGRRTSSGCMRMYPEDVTVFFDHVPVGTKVTVINQQVVVGAQGGRLWLSVYPSLQGWDQVENDEPVTEKAAFTSDEVDRINAAAGKNYTVDWEAVHRAFSEERGYPVAISKDGAATPVASVQ